jgi:hypothetical protein
MNSVWNFLLGAFAELQKEAVSFVMSICLYTWNNLAPTEQIFMIFDVSIFLKSVEKIQVSLKTDKNGRYFTLRPVHIFNHILFISS